MDKSDKGNPLAAALRLLNYRDRSESALKDKLEEKGFSSEEISSVIATLTDDGLLDDRRFARELAASRIRNKNWGPKRIALDLHRKGVPSEVVESVLGDISSETLELTAGRALQKWLEKKNAQECGIGEKDFARACRHLESRGFARGLILRLISPLRNTGTAE